MLTQRADMSSARVEDPGPVGPARHDGGVTEIDVKWEQASARRLNRAGLAAPLSGDVTATVAAMAGAHAQVMSAAEISVAMRTGGATATDVRDALWVTRSLVKTYG